jgi:hypothetical protein
MSTSPACLAPLRRPARLDPLGLAPKLERLGSAGLGVWALPIVSSALSGSVGLRGRVALDAVGFRLSELEWSTAS